MVINSIFRANLRKISVEREFRNKSRVLYICNDLSDSVVLGFYNSTAFRSKTDFRILAARRVATAWSEEVATDRIKLSLERSGVVCDVLNNNPKDLDNYFDGYPPDVVIFSNPYDDYREDFLKSYNIKDDVIKVHFLYATFLSGENVHDFFDNNAFFKNMDFVFVEKNISEYPKQFIETSSIKMFHKMQMISKRDKGGYFVLGWRPRWTVKNVALFRHELEICEFLINQNINLRVKVFIHPLLAENLETQPDDEVRTLFRNFASNQRVLLVEDKEYVSDLLEIDFLLSDPSTMVWDFLHLKRPFVLVHGYEKLTSLGWLVSRLAFSNRVDSDTLTKLQKYIDTRHLGALDRSKLYLLGLLFELPKYDPAIQILDFLNRK